MCLWLSVRVSAIVSGCAEYVRLAEHASMLLAVVWAHISKACVQGNSILEIYVRVSDA